MVNDVSPLAGLTALQGLHLLGTQVSDVSPVAGLQQLTIYNAPERVRAQRETPRRRSR